MQAVHLFWKRQHRQIKRIFGVTAICFGLQALFINAAPYEPGKSAAAHEKKFVRGRILVQPKAGLSEENLKQILGRHKGQSKKKNEKIRLHEVEVAEGSEEAAVQALSQDPNIEFAELDQLMPPIQTLNDSALGSLWHINKIEAPLAWDISQGDGITIAILDTGVDGTHPDLAGHLVEGYNFYDNNTNWSDVHGHGTRVAGAAAAIGNNSLGVAGIAWNAKIMPIRISGLDGWASFSTMATALTWAADRGAKVANMSYQAHTSASVQSAAQYLRNKGGVAVNSAGNTSAVDTSAASSSLITVAATDSSDNRASWSTFGNVIDVSAPGAYIYTTNRGGGYTHVNGTSFAAPITAGVIALMMEANPSLGANQLTSILLSTSQDLGAAGWDQYYGHGRINAAAAVRTAASTTVIDSQNPTVSFSGLSSGAVLKGLATINATAADNIAVSKVELYASGVLVGADTEAPYSFSFDTTKVADGNTVFSLKAHDTTGNSSSTQLTVAIRNTIDTTLPVITHLSPAEGAVLSKQSVTVQASATDNVAVVSMTVYLDGAVKGTSTSGSMSVNINTRKLSIGLHTIRVEAKDASGNIAIKSIQVRR